VKKKQEKGAEMKKKLEKGSGKIRKYFEKLRRTKMQPTIM